MQQEKIYYEVPVFDFDGENSNLEAQTTTSNADQYVSAEQNDRGHGDPEIRIVHRKPDQRDIYRFRIQDEELGICTYRGEKYDEIPVPVQHALTDTGYGDNRLTECNNTLFLWMEENAISNYVDRFVDDLEGLHIPLNCLEILRFELDVLSKMLLARFGVGPNTYWECWHDGEDSFSYVDHDMIDNLQDRLQAEIDDSPVSILQPTDEHGVELPAHCWDEKASTRNGEYLVVNQITPWTGDRFRFHVTGNDRCVFEGPTEVHCPPPVAHSLNEREVEIVNRPSVLYRTGAADVLATHIEMCNQMEKLDLLPEGLEGPLADPVHQSKLDTKVSAALLKFFEEKPVVAIKFHEDVCDYYDITGPEDLDMTKLDTVLSRLTDIIPDRFLEEF